MSAPPQKAAGKRSSGSRKKVSFAKRPPEKSDRKKLWEAILKTSRVTDDPIQAWEEHNKDLHDRCEYLNSLHIRELRYKSSNGTDFTVGMIPEAQFCGGGEYTIGGSYFNPNLPTGEIEIEANELVMEGASAVTPLYIPDEKAEESEDVRLKYRFLDLRREKLHRNIMLRSEVIRFLREQMWAKGFHEFQTPILTASSPEGARDYLVPARKHPGKFYALPQAPQQFKQLLMTSGFDRYFQIAPCFRDEDARGDRSPGEFYQLDMEMAFAAQDDVFAVIEDVLPPIFAKYGKYNIASSAPFRRIAYKDALETYGSDKPDLRIDLTCKNISDLFTASEFEPFKGQTVKAVPISNCHLTRKQIEKLLTDCEVQAGVKGYWFKMDENGELAGGVAKFVQGCKDALAERLGLTPNTLVVIAAGASATKLTGVLIKTFGANVEGHMDKERYEFCWIVDFPMYEIGDESGELEFCHNPFSMPGGGAATLDKAIRGEIDPLTITAQQYDLVCNGIELSSGAVRNHDPEIMIKAFELVRLGEDDVKKKFPAMYNAFCYGAPPHAGIAPGVDRMVMLLAGEDSDDIENVDIEKVRAALKELKGQLLGFWASNDEQTIPWLAGDFWAGEIWSGPYSQLINDPSTNIKLVHPTEGTVGYVDYWAIVEGTDEYDLACEWINWIESEEQQTAMATGISDKYPGEYYTYTPVNAKAIENLTPEQKIALELDPMPTCIKLLPYIADPDLKDAWTDLYQEFVG